MERRSSAERVLFARRRAERKRLLVGPARGRWAAVGRVLRTARRGRDEILNNNNNNIITIDERRADGNRGSGVRSDKFGWRRRPREGHISALVIRTRLSRRRFSENKCRP